MPCLRASWICPFQLSYLVLPKKIINRVGIGIERIRHREVVLALQSDRVPIDDIRKIFPLKETYPSAPAARSRVSCRRPLPLPPTNRCLTFPHNFGRRPLTYDS